MPCGGPGQRLQPSRHPGVRRGLWSLQPSPPAQHRHLQTGPPEGTPCSTRTTLVPLLEPPKTFRTPSPSVGKGYPQASCHNSRVVALSLGGAWATLSPRSSPRPQPNTESQGSGFMVAFTDRSLSFSHFGAIPSCNSWDIEASFKAARASPCQDFPIVTAH